MSDWTRSAHSSFCRWLNIRMHRRGPVAQDRPTTIEVQDQEALKRVMFYGDWNPVRAGICKHPGDYEYSSYRYYGYGEVNEWTAHLTPPQWYIDLADTPEERQALYRKLCDEYYYEDKLPSRTEADKRVPRPEEKCSTPSASPCPECSTVAGSRLGSETRTARSRCSVNQVASHPVSKEK